MTSFDRKFEAALAISATLPAEASRIVSELLGEPIRSSEILRRGLMTFKCLVQTERGQRVIVRFYPPRRTSVVNQEPDLIVRCRSAGIHVPQVIGDSRTGPSSELAYVVYYLIEGSTLSTHLPTCSAEQCGALAGELIHQLLLFNGIEFEGTGELVTGTEARDQTWASFVESSMQGGFEAIRQHSLLEEAAIRQVGRLLDRRLGEQRRARHSLVWGDVNFENILVDSAHRVSGLIDFESCLSGDPLATLGYCFAAQGPNAFFSTLLKAWPQPLDDHDHDLIFFYAVLRALRLARYAYLPLPTGYKRDPLTVIFPGIVPALANLSR